MRHHRVEFGGDLDALHGAVKFVQEVLGASFGSVSAANIEGRESASQGEQGGKDAWEVEYHWGVPRNL
ncbi:MAG: hypothetical protein ACKOAF_04955 [Actinomycetes bacterium]